MNAADREQFAAALVAMSEVYRHELSESMLSVYWAVLSRYDLQSVLHALEAHAADPDHGHFMPKPADLVRVISGGSNAKALEAWAKVIAAVGLLGSYKSVCFDDAAIHLTIHDMGGWPSVCSITDKVSPFKQKEFCERYTAIARRNPTRYPSHLPGVFELENKHGSHPFPPPALVGDQSKAERILSSGSEAEKISITLTDSRIARIGHADD